MSGCEVCCPDSFYLCIAQVVRAGGSHLTGHKNAGEMTVGLERQIEALVKIGARVWLKNEIATPAPTTTNADPQWTDN